MGTCASTLGLTRTTSLCPSSLQEPDGRRLTRCVENEAIALMVDVDLATTVATTLERDPRRKSICDVASPVVTKEQSKKSRAVLSQNKWKILDLVQNVFALSAVKTGTGENGHEECGKMQKSRILTVEEGRVPAKKCESVEN